MLSDEICKYVEGKQKKINQRYEKMWMEYLSYLMRKYPGSMQRIYTRMMKEAREQTEMFEEILEEFPPSASRKYLEVLKKYRYRMKDKILDCISTLSTSLDISKDMDIISKKPWIDSVSGDAKHGFLVNTKEGSFSFYSVTNVYGAEVAQIQQYHKKIVDGKDHTMLNGFNPYAPGDLSYECHFATEQFAYRFPEIMAVTSLCPHKFSDHYWFHSYNLIANGQMVIDIANGFMMDFASFERLLEPIVLDCVFGSDIPSRVSDVKRSSYPYRNTVDVSTLKGLAIYHIDTLPLEEQEKIRKRIW